MANPAIVGITISVDISNKDYGNGTQSFISVQGKYPDPSTLEEVLVDGLDMYFAAFKSLLSSRYATGVMAGPEFKKDLDQVSLKYTKVRSFLTKKEGASSGE